MLVIFRALGIRAGCMEPISIKLLRLHVRLWKDARQDARHDVGCKVVWPFWERRQWFVVRSKQLVNCYTGFFGTQLGLACLASWLDAKRAEIDREWN